MNKEELKQKNKNSVIPISVALDVVVKDKAGNVIDSRHCEHDLLTRNATHMLGTLMTPQHLSYQNEGGAWAGYTRDMYIRDQYWWYKIAIGLSDIAPTFADYQLKQKYAETTSVGIVYLVDYDTYSEFSFSATITIWESKDFKECGLFHNMGPSLMARDVFATPVHVDPGQAITIKYTFRLGLPPA